MKWNVDKLVVDGKVKEDHQDEVKDININTTEKAIELQSDMRHSPALTHDSGSFQGHTVTISSQDDIVPSLHAIYSDIRGARATHNPYAYRIKSGNRYIEHYDDDGEFGAGAKLLELMRRNDVTDKVVCVTRWMGGKHSSRARFEHIIDSAKCVLQIA